jgi:hypothetical protein
MKTTTQLNPQIPVETSKGAGFCVAWIDYSQEHNTLWRVLITATREYWDLPQPEIRGVENVSMGRVDALKVDLTSPNIFDRQKQPSLFCAPLPRHDLSRPLKDKDGNYYEGCSRCGKSYTEIQSFPNLSCVPDFKYRG